MKICTESDKPLYLQIQEGLETAILSGAYAEETQIPSTTELATGLKVNPATALKGVNELVRQGILYKKRGIGVFVARGAQEQIYAQRRHNFIEDYLKRMLEEAQRLNFTKEELLDWLKGAEYETDRDKKPL